MAEQEKFNQGEQSGDKSAFDQFGDKPQQSQQEADEIRRRKEAGLGSDQDSQQSAGQAGDKGQQQQGQKGQVQRQQGDQDLGDDSKDSNNLK